MAELYEVMEEKERVILAAVSVDDTDDTKESLEELEELAKTAGAECVASVIQNRERIHPGTYFGKGKIEEIAALIRETGADGIICDDELSPAQMKNLEAELKKIERCQLLILDDAFLVPLDVKERAILLDIIEDRHERKSIILSS